MVLAALGADHILVLGDEGVHLVEVHGVHVDALAGGGGLDQLVRPLPGAAALAVNQRIGEGAHMAGGDPGGGVHQNGGVQAHVVVGFLHEFLQPRLLDVVLELHAQGAVVPGVGQTAVDLRTGIDIAPVLAEVHDHVQSFFTVLHGISSKCFGFLRFGCLLYRGIPCKSRGNGGFCLIADTGNPPPDRQSSFRRPYRSMPRCSSRHSLKAG